MTVKSVIILLVFVIALSIPPLIWGYKAIKEKVLHRLVHRGLESYFEKKYNTNILIGTVEGNLLNNLFLNKIQLKGMKGLPKDLQINIKSIKLNYTFKDLIKRTPKIELTGLELAYKNIKIPIKFYQQNKVITLTFDKIFILNQFQSAFYNDQKLILNGLCSFKGRIVLEKYEPKYYDVKIEANDLEIFYPKKLMTKSDIGLNISNKTGNYPCLVGSILIKEAEYLGEVNKVELKDITPLGIMDGIFIDMAIKGNNIKIRNDSLDILLKTNLLLRKEPKDRPFLLGKIESLQGTYIAYQNRFNLKKAEIIFNGKTEKEAKIDILGEARIKGYRILASVKGTPSNSRLDISSRPELPRNEIIALLLFGKRVRELSVSEENELLKGQDMAGSFISKFFLGKAEAKIAETMGVDNFSIQPDISGNSQGMQMPSVEVGKYLGNGRLYGAYNIGPGKVNSSQDVRQKPDQAISGEYSITENIVVKGERNFSESIKVPQEDKISAEFRWKF